MHKHTNTHLCGLCGYLNQKINTYSISIVARSCKNCICLCVDLPIFPFNSFPSIHPSIYPSFHPSIHPSNPYIRHISYHAHVTLYTIAYMTRREITFICEYTLERHCLGSSFRDGYLHTRYGKNNYNSHCTRCREMNTNDMIHCMIQRTNIHPCQ